MHVSNMKKLTKQLSLGVLGFYHRLCSRKKLMLTHKVHLDELSTRLFVFASKAIMYSTYVRTRKIVHSSLL